MSKKKKHQKWGGNANNMADAIAAATEDAVRRVLDARIPKHGRSSSVSDVLPARSTPTTDTYRRPSPMGKPRAKNLTKSYPGFDSPGNRGDVSPDEVEEMIRLLDGDPEGNRMVTPGEYKGKVVRDATRTEKSTIREIAHIEIGTRIFKALGAQVAEADATDRIIATQDGSRDQLARLGAALTRTRLRLAYGGGR